MSALDIDVWLMSVHDDFFSFIRFLFCLVDFNVGGIKRNKMVEFLDKLEVL